MSDHDSNATGQPAQPRLSAIRSRHAWIVLIAVTVIGLGLDLGSKWYAFRHIAPQPVVIDRERVLELQARHQPLGSLIPTNMEPRHVIPGVLDFSLVLNPGAVFGIGAGKRWFFVAFTGAAMALAVWMFGAWTRAQDRFAHVGIGLLVAGGVGNLFDRLIYGCVRDFIHPLPGVQLPFGWTMPLSGGREVWPYVSNIADLWLLIGIGMLMVYLWKQGTHRKVAKPVPSSASSP